MRRMRTYILLLILWLTLLLSVLGLQLGATEGRGHTALFIGVVGVLAMLILGFARRPSQVWLITGGVVALYAIAASFEGMRSAGNLDLYMRFTEVAALALTSGLAWLLNRSVEEFEQAVQTVSLPTGDSQLLPFSQVKEYLHNEMQRARRHQHPLSVAMITVPAQDLEAALPRVIAEAQQAAIKRYVHVWLGRYLTSHIRRTDVVAHHAKDGRFVLMAPETPAEQTGEMLRRLSSQAATEFGVDLHYSIADFPSQALTSDELLSHVAEHLAAAPEPSTLSLERAKADVSPVASADL